MAGGAELAELAHELEQLGGHGDIVKEVQAEVAEVDSESQGIEQHPLTVAGRASSAPAHRRKRQIKFKKRNG